MVVGTMFLLTEAKDQGVQIEELLRIEVRRKLFSGRVVDLCNSLSRTDVETPPLS